MVPDRFSQPTPPDPRAVADPITANQKPSFEEAAQRIPTSAETQPTNTGRYY